MANPKRRAQITAAATELFDARGFYGAGMSDIAAACNMSASSLYNHFSSKHEVLAEVITGSLQELLYSHASAISTLDDPVELLRVSMRNHVLFHCENAQATRVTNKEVDALEGPMRSVVRQLRRDYVSRWTAIVRSGVDRGIFQVPDAKLTCYALIDMGIGVELWFRTDRAYDAESLSEYYANLALRMVGYQT